MIWKHNTIRTNPANLLIQDKAANSKTVRNRNVSANSVSVKNKAANQVVVVSRVGDRAGYLE